MVDNGRTYSGAKHVSDIMKECSWKWGQMQRPGQNSSSFLTFIRAVTVQSGPDSWRWYSKYRWSEQAQHCSSFHGFGIVKEFYQNSAKRVMLAVQACKVEGFISFNLTVRIFCSQTKTTCSWLCDIWVSLAHYASPLLMLIGEIMSPSCIQACPALHIIS